MNHVFFNKNVLTFQITKFGFAKAAKTYNSHHLEANNLEFPNQEAHNIEGPVT